MKLISNFRILTKKERKVLAYNILKKTKNFTQKRPSFLYRRNDYETSKVNSLQEAYLRFTYQNLKTCKSHEKEQKT